MAAMTAMNPSVQAEEPRRTSGWAMAVRIGLPVLLFAGLASPAPRADDWGGLVTISATMGVGDGRICTGEASRGDIGCAANAPYVSRTSGWLGIGTNAPIADLHVVGSAIIQNNAHGIFRFTSDNASNYIQSAPAGPTMNEFKDLRFSGWWASAPKLILTSHGTVGIATATPSTTLHILGSLRMAAETSTTLQPCDTNRTGAIKYQSGDFHLCRNGTAWESLASIGSGGTPERIVSGTSYVQANETGSVTISGTTYIGSNRNTSAALEIGGSPTGNHYSYIDLVGDTTYNDFGLRIIRGSNGANTTSNIQHRGTGAFLLQAIDAAPIILQTSNTEAMRITPEGNVGIGYSAPAYSLDVVSSSQATDTTVARFLSHAPMSGFSKTNIRLMKSTLYGAELSGYLNQGIDSGLVFSTIASGAATERIRISSNGNTGIGTATPTTALDVSGTVSATTLQLADNPANPCTAANKGMAKVVNGRIYVCRYP